MKKNSAGYAIVILLISITYIKKGFASSNNAGCLSDEFNKENVYEFTITKPQANQQKNLLISKSRSITHEADSGSYQVQKAIPFLDITNLFRSEEETSQTASPESYKVRRMMQAFDTPDTVDSKEETSQTTSLESYKVRRMMQAFDTPDTVDSKEETSQTASPESYKVRRMMQAFDTPDTVDSKEETSQTASPESYKVRRMMQAFDTPGTSKVKKLNNTPLLIFVQSASEVNSYNSYEEKIDFLEKLLHRSLTKQITFEEIQDLKHKYESTVKLLSIDKNNNNSRTNTVSPVVRQLFLDKKNNTNKKNTSAYFVPSPPPAPSVKAAVVTSYQPLSETLLSEGRTKLIPSPPPAPSVKAAVATSYQPLSETLLSEGRAKLIPSPPPAPSVKAAVVTSYQPLSETLLSEGRTKLIPSPPPAPSVKAAVATSYQPLSETLLSEGRAKLIPSPPPAPSVKAAVVTSYQPLSETLLSEGRTKLIPSPPPAPSVKAAVATSYQPLSETLLSEGRTKLIPSPPPAPSVKAATIAISSQPLSETLLSEGRAKLIPSPPPAPSVKAAVVTSYQPLNEQMLSEGKLKLTPVINFDNFSNDTNTNGIPNNTLHKVNNPTPITKINHKISVIKDYQIHSILNIYRIISNALTKRSSITNMGIAAGGDKLSVQKNFWSAAIKENSRYFDSRNVLYGSTHSIVLGYDLTGNNNTIGIAYSNFSSNYFGIYKSAARSKGNTLSLYGTKNIVKNLFFNGAFTVIKTKTFSKDQLSEFDLKGAINSLSYNYEGDLNYKFILDNCFEMIPFIGLQYSTIRNKNRYILDESSNILYNHNNISVLYGNLGTKFIKLYNPSLSTQIIPSLHVAIEQPIGNKSKTIKNHFIVSNNLIITNNNISQSNTLGYKINFNLSLRKYSNEIFVSYNSYLQKKYVSHQLMAKIKLAL